MKKLQVLFLVLLAAAFSISATGPAAEVNAAAADELVLQPELIAAIEEVGPPCDYRNIIRSIPGFKACLLAAQEPGYELKVSSVKNTGPCLGGPIGDITFYFWKDYICPPPCLGPPDILIAEVYICACTVVSWNCY